MQTNGWECLTSFSLIAPDGEKWEGLCTIELPFVPFPGLDLMDICAAGPEGEEIFDEFYPTVSKVTFDPSDKTFMIDLAQVDYRSHPYIDREQFDHHLAYIRALGWDMRHVRDDIPNAD